MREDFGARFNGVFASNERFPLRGYSIVNTLPRNTAGEHWLAICDGYLYDSFGRDKSGEPEQKNRGNELRAALPRVYGRLRSARSRRRCFDLSRNLMIDLKHPGSPCR